MARYEIRPYTTYLNSAHMRLPHRLLGIGTLATHLRICLMLLGSPPDMVHNLRSRKTRSSLQTKRGADHPSQILIRGNHPCCSGLQVQGTADSPAGMALFHILLILLYQSFKKIASSKSFFIAAVFCTQQKELTDIAEEIIMKEISRLRRHFQRIVREKSYNGYPDR